MSEKEYIYRVYQLFTTKTNDYARRITQPGFR